MKKRSRLTWGAFSCLCISILAVAPSCKKNTKLPDESIEKTHAVKFKIKDFETVVTPLKTQSGHSKLAANSQNDNKEQLLYHWDFDNSSAAPTAALDDAALIDYNNGKTDYGFVAGWPNTGKAISFKGAKEILIKIPASGIRALSQLSFDANSSGTGPRALVLSYSTDRGNTFRPLTDTLHYPIDLTTTAKFSITQSLAAVELSATASYWLKIALFEGNRPVGNSYNENTGTFKMDNLKIIGATDESILPSKLYYHIFDAGTKMLVKSGSLSAKESFDVALPTGAYYFSLIVKNSTDPLIFPSTINDIRSLAVSNPFHEQLAEIFAARDTFEVKESIDRVLTVNRIYSEIKFESLDSEDLSRIDSIHIRQLHAAFQYYPFASAANDKQDQTVLRLVPGFSVTNKTFRFHQFMGDIAQDVPIKYELTLFKDGAAVRVFELGSAIRNNVQILFRGKLLEGVGASQGFQVVKNEKWRDAVVVDY
ncbi:hypothetical protein AB3466_21600 [Sphingobacterium thalpophilum]|uniref:hypothetical protein n=1 Tax=Sphingobacterium thalpophilum TaxID=259 RepID=UPI0031D8C535